MRFEEAAQTLKHAQVRTNFKAEEESFVKPMDPKP